MLEARTQRSMTGLGSKSAIDAPPSPILRRMFAVSFSNLVLSLFFTRLTKGTRDRIQLLMIISSRITKMLQIYLLVLQSATKCKPHKFIFPFESSFLANKYFHSVSIDQIETNKKSSWYHLSCNVKNYSCALD